MKYDLVPPDIVIAVATYKRPQQLARLLRSLPTALEADARTRVEILDNEPSPVTAQIVRDEAVRLPFDIGYHEVRSPGLAAARNAALELAVGADFLAFIDDDEVATRGWLQALLTAQETYGADAVAGPVESAFVGDVPGWVTESNCFDVDRINRPTGALMPWCAAGNCLISARLIGLVSEGFDARYALTGGEDSHFFLRATRAGARIVWTEEARVIEIVEPERLRVGWVVRRAFRSGNSRTLIERDVIGGPGTFFVRLAKGAGSIIIGMAVTVLGACCVRRGRVVRGLQRIGAGSGMLVGLLGLRYREYADGRPSDAPASGEANAARARSTNAS